jgi:hypothetical protein
MINVLHVIFHSTGYQIVEPLMPVLHVIFQVSDYSQLPDIATLAAKLKTCLQESDEVPRDITALFDNSLFKLDTSLVPKAIK